MKQKSKRTLTPKLRFPEFGDEPGWEEKTGDSLFDQINERNPAPGLPVLAITQEHGAIPRDMIDYHVTVTEKSIESYKVVQVGDFIISLRSFQGGIEYSQYHGICSPAYVILRRRTEGSAAYFKHYLKTERFIRTLTRNLEGLRDGKMISYKQFSELLLPVPPPPEQQKIADCLGSLDALIAAEGRKLAALRDHKRGLMQQLFPQPGQTQPRLRFPEFRDKEAWEEKSIGEVFQFKQGVQVPVGNQYAKKDSDMVRFIRIVDLTQESEPLRYIVNPGDEHIIKSNELFMIRYGTPGIVAIGYEGVIANNLFRIIWKGKKEFIPKFWFYIFKNLEEYISNLSASSSMPAISFSTLSTLSVIFPTIPEQQMIADCLTALDERIAAQAAKIETLKQHKRGLMQQLFPMPEEHK
jgi:type I restriction enzyme, S subunit